MNEAWSRMKLAEGVLEFADVQYAGAVSAVKEIQEQIAYYEQRLSDIQAQIDSLDQSAYNFSEQLAMLYEQRSLCELMLAGLRANLEIKEAVVVNAENARSQAKTQLELAQAAYNEAKLAYDGCMQRLRDCEQSSGCVPSDPPGGEGGFGIPPLPDEGWQPGEGFVPIGGDGPGERPFFPWGSDEGADGGEIGGEGADEQGECPCDDCFWELLNLRNTEEMEQEAWDAWKTSYEDLFKARDAYAAAMDEQMSAQEKAMEAWAAVLNLQGKLDSFMADHVSVAGVGGDPSSGPNHVNYKGVDIYFSDSQMFNDIYNVIKDGIDDLAQQLEKAKAEEAAADAALEAATAAANAAEAAYNNAVALEQFTWNNYLTVLGYYLDALKAYEDCLDKRQACIEAHPDECEGESVEPDEGHVGSDGSTQGKGGKQPSEHYSAINALNSALDELEILVADSSARVTEAESALTRAGDVVRLEEEAYSEFAESVRQATMEIERRQRQYNSLIEALPDRAFIVGDDPQAPEGYSRKAAGNGWVIYPDGMDSEIDSWLRSYSAVISGIDFNNGTSDITDIFTESTALGGKLYPAEELGRALMEYAQASGELAGAKAEKEFLEGQLQTFSEEIGSRTLQVRGILDATDMALDAVITLQSGG
jgi:multidrug efflux pump subunit AcrA (membrane-fusion protein)